MTFSRGNLSLTARSTVRPPTPESKMPIGSEFIKGGGNRHFRSQISNSRFRIGGGDRNRTDVWKPSPKESTYLAASLKIRPRAVAEAAKNCAPTRPEEFRSAASDLHQRASPLR